MSPVYTLAAALLFAGSVAAKTLHPDHMLMRGEVQRYGDWWVGCSNTADCTMLGFPTALEKREINPAVSDMAIQINLKGGMESALAVELVPLGIEEDSKAAATSHGPFVLNVEYRVAAISPPHGFSRKALLKMESDAVFDHLSKGKVLEGRALSNNQTIVRFPLAEFKRAYRAMQRRYAQLQKDLTDKAIEDLPGELPDGSSMPVPEKPRRLAAMPHIVSGFVPIRTDKNCGSHRALDMRHYRFPNDVLLWSYSCDNGDYATRTYWEMATRSVHLPVPLSLPEPRDLKVHAGTQGLENAIFDFDFGILREYRYQKGHTDCGTFRAWGFTNLGWKLLERREMPVCKGLNPDDWIRTHFESANGAGPDE
jgi:hypothetical protein